MSRKKHSTSRPTSFWMGTNAKGRGASPSDNPFQRGTQDHKLWFKGYRYAGRMQKQYETKRSGNPLGEEAYRLGRSYETNPFVIGTRAYSAWLASWSEAATKDTHRVGYLDGVLDINVNPYSMADPRHLHWAVGYSRAKCHIRVYGRIIEDIFVADD